MFRLLTSSCIAIVRDTAFTRAEGWPIELSNFASVIAFVNRFEEDGGQLDIVIANADVAMHTYKLTEDGWDTT